MPINAANPTAPSIAPVTGTLLIIASDTDNAVISTDNAAAFANVAVASISPNAYKITPKMPTMNVIIPSATIADVATFLQLLMIFNATARLPITNAIDAADAITLSDGSVANMHNAADNIPIITAMATIVPVAF